MGGVEESVEGLFKIVFGVGVGSGREAVSIQGSENEGEGEDWFGYFVRRVGVLSEIKSTEARSRFFFGGGAVFYKFSNLDISRVNSLYPSPFEQI